MKKYCIFLFALLVGLILNPIQKVTAQYSIPAKQAWWYDARFGMFIHFGSYSYLAQGEWAFAIQGWTKSNYQTQVSANFNPLNFNATTIVTLAKNAGMKYLVITAKHHEGFCMWKTAVASFKDATGTKMFDLQDFTKFGSRDILQELKTACDAQGIKFCLYYSIVDWDHPTQLYNSTTNYTDMSTMTARTNYINDMKAQLSELVTKYHPAVLWFDGDWTYNNGSPTLLLWWTKADGVSLYSYLIGLDPNLIVNERVFRGAELGDFDCPEQTVPSSPMSRQWETNQTMNNSWGYNAGDNSWKSTTTLVQQLVQVVSRDGNYLLNIGPMGDGTVPSPSVTILNGFSAWMSIYSSSIYGTTRSPYSSEPPWGYYTKKLGYLFAHVFNWPTNGQLSVPTLSNTISRIYLLNATNTSLSYTISNGNINISVPTSRPNAINSVVVIEVSGVPTAGTSGSTIVSGGTYELIARHSGKVIGINGASTTDGALAVQQTYTGNTSQQFVITDLGSGYYRLSPASNTNEALDVYGWSTADGGVIDQWTYGGGNNQRWQIVSQTGGYYQIISQSSGKCMDITGASTADGAAVIQWTCGSGYNQQFTFSRLKNTPSIADGTLSDNINIFPNPSDGSFKVEGITKGLLQVFDLNGKLLLSRNIETDAPTINSGLSSGLYIIKITEQGNVTTLRLVIK